ncbi:MAG: DNA gyrase/topoisomerase IV subunit A [Planctomycetales bacterium]
MAKKKAKTGKAAKAKKTAPVRKEAARKKPAEKKPSRATKVSLDKQGSSTDGNFEELNVANDQDGDRVEFVSISQETRRRYLNYAMSVIQSRALPDVRDGLKPVQRRILYVMYNGLHLTHDAKTRKCAKICGDTTGNYHPHGDQSVYDALVRLAQDFTYRAPLIDGQGNFGSVMGLPAAAPRYTEARLTAIAEHLMNELKYDTVDMRPTYDGATAEPVVLPSRYPNLLVNGAQGIAVGMATSIPPHNLGEVIRACIHLIDSPQATVTQLMKYIKGPDFPLGGRIVTDRSDIRKMYEEGRGSVKVRGEWRFDKERRKEVQDRLVIYSLPYHVETGSLTAEIGNIIANRKLPMLEEVNDETDDRNGLRIVLELKSGADPDAVIAYLYKNTSLEQNFSYNATCLVPDDSGMMVPARATLAEMLQHFLVFRQETVRKRFQYQLAQLEKRIHILEGFCIIFDGLDKALKLIRASTGKQDACKKLMKAFPLDEVQTMAILELQLYRISSLEIDDIREELADKQKQASKIRSILKSEVKLWKVVRTELEELSNQFADRRRTGIGSSEEITEFAAETYIVRENTNVVVTREGWLKRVGRLAKVSSTRVREGDSVLDVLPGSTVDNAIFFSSDGVAYTLSIDQVPPSSGYGEPLAKHVRMGDGVSIVMAISTDARFTPEDELEDDASTAPYLLVATAQGQVMRVSLSTFRPPSTKVGRKFCRLRKGDSVVHVELVTEHQTMFLATRKARIIHFSIDDVPVLSGPGIGVKGIKMESGDEVLGAKLLTRPSDTLRVDNSNGTTLSFGQMKYNVTSRGGKGVKTSQRNEFSGMVPEPIELVDWAALEE